MSTTETAQAWDNLMLFLSSDEDLSDEDILQDLRKSGIDTDSFLKQIGDTVRKGIQSQRRRQAEEERSEVEKSDLEIRQRVLQFPIETIRQMAKEAEKGKFGTMGQELAIACRNKQDAEPTESELRSLVEDILLTAGDESKTDDRHTTG